MNHGTEEVMIEWLTNLCDPAEHFAEVVAEPQ